ncbi:MAG: septum formation protein Maf [Flavobacteriales bacterium]|jgi:septum formation protein|nr:septum formation protein Maf [Flavobacteriales bacterium]
MLNKLDKYTIVLGSNSSRRKKILEKMNIKVEVRASNIDESITSDINIIEIPVFLAQKKSNSLSKDLKEKEILITADTVVIYKDKIITKPKNSLDAKKILEKLSNNTHQVITGVCIRSQNKEHTFSNITEVTFNNLNDNDIDYYIKQFNPYDKAGSYGIQEWIGLIGVKKIKGSYTNVVGLPSSQVYQELNKFI